MGKRLYVGNLSYNIDSSELEQLFSQFGSVTSAQVISDRETGRSKGFGFVEMEDESSAKAAIEGLTKAMGVELGPHGIRLHEVKARRVEYGPS